MSRHRERLQVPSEELELFNDSLEECLSDPGFLPRFYEIFLATSPEVREKFANTDFRHQTRVLKASLMLLLFAAQGLPEGWAHLERIAEIHGPGKLDIPDHHYDLWLESLLQAAAERHRSFTPEMRQAWTEVLAPGIEHMRDYRRRVSGQAPGAKE